MDRSERHPAQLEEVLEHAARPGLERRVAWIQGSPGSGRSSLLRALSGLLEAGAAGDGVAVVRVDAAAASTTLAGAVVGAAAARLGRAPPRGLATGNERSVIRLPPLRVAAEASAALHALDGMARAEGRVPWVLVDGLDRSGPMREQVGIVLERARRAAPAVVWVLAWRPTADQSRPGDLVLELDDHPVPHFQAPDRVVVLGREGDAAAADRSDWAQKRDAREVTLQETSEHVREAIRELVEPLPPPRPLPWRVLYADGKLAHDVIVLGSKLAQSFVCDFRFLPVYRRTEAEWRRRTSRGVLRERLVWVADGSFNTVRAVSVALGRSRGVVARSADGGDEPLRIAERGRARSLREELLRGVAEAFVAGTFYLRGEPLAAGALGDDFAAALLNAARCFAEGRDRDDAVM